MTCSRALTLFMTSLFFMIDAQAAGLKVVRFSGALSQQAQGESLILRRFEALLLHDGAVPFFAVLDDERDGCPWPESFGQVASNGVTPHLIYIYEGSTYTLPLPALVLDVPAGTTVGSQWSVDGWTHEVTAMPSGADASWTIEARERRGRRQTLNVSADSGSLVKATQDVFMGQGVRFELNLNQTSSETLDDSTSVRVGQLRSELLTLQAALKRRPDTQLSDLSPRQVGDAGPQLASLTTLAADTPLQEFVLRIRRNVEQQARRIAQAMNRQEQLLDRAAPEFSLNLIVGGSLSSKSLRGRIVVLHFWKYAEKPLSEPYGQVGYLEFLYNKYKQMNVDVIGVAMNRALLQSETARAGQRTARKLAEFMNLSYAIGYDDGSLLRELGDPRDSAGQLPLWVVLSPEGKIIHYHSGFYEVDRQQGLKQLNEVLTRRIRAADG
ncbi:MAG: TlpA family protein disulfide reductase, partial [Fuerstiella sp.]|nr:TlpA family protein disulfide reductase [Fuerstiella sp.]